MLIDFNKIKEICISKMNDGVGDINAKMYNDDNYRIIFTTNLRIHHISTD